MRAISGWGLLPLRASFSAGCLSVLALTGAYLIGCAPAATTTKSGGGLSKAEVSEVQQTLTSIYTAEEVYAVEMGTYSGSFEEIGVTVPQNSKFEYALSDVGQTAFTASATLKEAAGEALSGDQATINQDGVKGTTGKLGMHFPDWK